MNEALQNLLTRRSCRKFKPDPVKDEELNAILEAGTYAPTGRGTQSPLILAITTPENVALVESLNAGVMGNLLNAAHALGVDSCYIWRAKETFATPEGEELKAKWGIPANYEGAGNIILGYGLPEGFRPAAPRKENYIIRV